MFQTRLSTVVWQESVEQEIQKYFNKLVYACKLSGQNLFYFNAYKLYCS